MDNSATELKIQSKDIQITLDFENIHRFLENVPEKLMLENLKRREIDKHEEIVSQFSNMSLKSKIKSLFEHKSFDIIDALTPQQIDSLMLQIIKLNLNIPFESRQMMLNYVKANYDPISLINLDEVINSLDEDEFFELIANKVSVSDLLHHIANNL